MLVEIWYSMLDGRRVGYSCVSGNMVFHARWQEGRILL